MKPSRIVKSAYRRAWSAGYRGTLKTFVHEVGNDSCHVLQPERVVKACSLWQDNKDKQRARSRGGKAATR